MAGGTLIQMPDAVNIECYGGDTFEFTVTAPTAWLSGRKWSAQIRSTFDATLVDGVIDIQEPTVADGPAILTLTAELTAQLVGLALTRAPRAVSPRAVSGGVYSGVWDLQVAPLGGGDPTTTITGGTVKIKGDVTRP